MSSSTWSSVLVVVCAACTPATPVAPSVAAPEIEATPVDAAAVVLPEAREEPTPSSFAVRFGSEELAPLSRMRMVIEPGGGERRVEMASADVSLYGVAELAGSTDRWLVGVSGMTREACIVVRMTMEREGDGLRGWATIDTEGWASAVSVVATPM